LRAISISAKDSFEIEGIANMKFLTKKEREVLREWGNINYRTRSEEIFARTFQRAVDEGMTFREATQMATRGVYNTIEKSQSHLERVLSAISEATKRSGVREKLSERTHEAFEEATELMKWFNDPAYRKGKQIPQLMEMFAKQNPGYTYKEYNELLNLLQDQSPQAVQKYWKKFRDVGKELKPPDIVEEFAKPPKKLTLEQARRKMSREMDKKIENIIGLKKDIGRATKRPETKYSHLSDDIVYQRLAKARKDLKEAPNSVGVTRLLRLRGDVEELNNEIGRRNKIR
jgi:hypothetical protein